LKSLIKRFLALFCFIKQNNHPAFLTLLQFLVKMASKNITYALHNYEQDQRNFSA